ncbi:MAG: small-conductance mechanosensitive channel [Alphaproteobacteria bacterium]
MLFEKSVQNDDLIELPDAIFGTIKKTTSRYTLLETFDGKEIMIPNEDFVTTRVTNWTYSNKKGRIELFIGVSYKSDIKKAHALILEAAQEHGSSDIDSPPVCYLTEFADSSVNFRLLFWVDDILVGRLQPKSDVLFSIWDKFHNNNIEIPFPQMDVHVKGEVKK